jgi:phospholipid transport system substrate-binding protein
MNLTLARNVNLVMRIRLFLILLLTSSLAWARPTGTEVIQKANTRLRDLLASKAPSPKVTAELRGLFDIGDLTKRALVDHWDKLTPAQRSGMQDTMRSIVEKNYIKQLRSNLEYEIKYVGEEKQGDGLVVKTVILAQRKGRPLEIPVDYVLRAEGDTWRAYDVITDEVSILNNYRSQFNRIIAKEGIAGLQKRMKDRLEKGE